MRQLTGREKRSSRELFVRVVRSGRHQNGVVAIVLSAGLVVLVVVALALGDAVELLHGNVDVVTDDLVELVGNFFTLWQLLEGLVDGFDEVVGELVGLLEGLLDSLWNSDLVVISERADLSPGHGFFVLEVKVDLLGQRHLKVFLDHLLASDLGS